MIVWAKALNNGKDRSAGIECYLQDESVVRLDWFWSNAMGGIKLIVREKDAAEAEKDTESGPFDGAGG